MRTFRLSIGRRGVVLAGVLLAGATAAVLILTTGSPDRSEERGPGEAAPRTGTTPGWLLHTADTGLVPFGLTCDSLPLYTGSTRPASGTVLSEQLITQPLDLSNGDITIDRSCIRPTTIAPGMPIITTTDFNRCAGDGTCPAAPGPVTISNSEIDGSLLPARDSALSTAFLGVANLRGNYIHDVGSGIAFMNTGDELSTTVEGNYVTRLRAHGDGATTGNHSDAFTIRDFDTGHRADRSIVVRNNRFDCSSGNDTGAVFIQTLTGNVGNVTLTGNLLEGGGYQLGLEQRPDYAYAGLSAVDNRFSGTGFGPTYVAGGSGWTEWRGNYLHTPSAPDGRGEAVGAP